MRALKQASTVCSPHRHPVIRQRAKGGGRGSFVTRELDHSCTSGALRPAKIAFQVGAFARQLAWLRAVGC